MRESTYNKINAKIGLMVFLLWRWKLLIIRWRIILAIQYFPSSAPTKNPANYSIKNTIAPFRLSPIPKNRRNPRSPIFPLWCKQKICSWARRPPPHSSIPLEREPPLSHKKFHRFQQPQKNHSAISYRPKVNTKWNFWHRRGKDCWRKKVLCSTLSGNTTLASTKKRKIRSCRKLSIKLALTRTCQQVPPFYLLTRSVKII